MKDYLKFEKTLRSVKNIFKHLLIIKLQDVFLVLFPFLLLLNIVVFKNINSRLENRIQSNLLVELPIKEFSFSPYPQLSLTESLSTFIADTNSPLSLISANAAIVIDNESQVVLFSKNSLSVFPMASTTKIMTALVALDYYKDTHILTIQSDNVSPVIVGFKKGEQIYFKDLLYAMMLPSGNDAALAIAQNFPGGEKAFINAMNDKAKELHLIHTTYGDSSGLSALNKTTAYELAKLASYAIRNPKLAKVVGTKQYILYDVTGKNMYSISNINKLLGIDGVNGIKTGFTEEAGEVLVTSRVVETHTIITVVMKSKNRFFDTQNILSFINKNINYLDVDSLLNTHFSNTKKF